MQSLKPAFGGHPRRRWGLSTHRIVLALPPESGCWDFRDLLSQKEAKIVSSSGAQPEQGQFIIHRSVASSEAQVARLPGTKGLMNPACLRRTAPTTRHRGLHGENQETRSLCPAPNAETRWGSEGSGKRTRQICTGAWRTSGVLPRAVGKVRNT